MCDTQATAQATSAQRLTVSDHDEQHARRRPTGRRGRRSRSTRPSRPARSSFSIFIASIDDDRLPRADRVAGLAPARGRPCPASAPRRRCGPDAVAARRSPRQRRRPLSDTSTAHAVDLNRHRAAAGVRHQRHLVAACPPVAGDRRVAGRHQQRQRVRIDARRVDLPRRDRRPSTLKRPSARWTVTWREPAVDLDLVAHLSATASARACAFQRPGTPAPAAPAVGRRRAPGDIARLQRRRDGGDLFRRPATASTNGRPFRALQHLVEIGRVKSARRESRAARTARRKNGTVVLMPGDEVFGQRAAHARDRARPVLGPGHQLRDHRIVEDRHVEAGASRRSRRGCRAPTATRSCRMRPGDGRKLLSGSSA